MSKRELDTEPMPPPVAAEAPSNDRYTSMTNGEIEELHRDFDRQLVRNQLALQNKAPVDYAERAQSDGKDGARWFAVHDVPKPTEHATIPEGRIIVETTPAPVQEDTDPLPGNERINATQPMLRAVVRDRRQENTFPVEHDDDVRATPSRLRITLGMFVGAAIAMLLVSGIILFVSRIHNERDVHVVATSARPTASATSIAPVTEPLVVPSATATAASSSSPSAAPAPTALVAPSSSPRFVAPPSRSSSPMRPTVERVTPQKIENTKPHLSIDEEKEK